ncbi:MAG: bifunctional UDP-3-O-[3-hydroxymyristoyl] N-acetylglucosamine deacetylase/3-hydroxyacyl-ACP dehydratase [Dehalococcoidia bacterium]
MKQRTILREVSLSGKALHTGLDVRLTLKPASVDHGVVFRRMDLYGRPELKTSVDLLADRLIRGTDIASGYTKVHTVEHILSALGGCGVDNVVIELNASEPPIIDGSARGFVDLIARAEPVDQESNRKVFVLRDPLSISDGNRSLVALPYDGFRITCTSTDDRGVHTQHLSLDIDAETYETEIAPARTFTIYEDIEELLKLGKISGGSLDSALVIKGDTVLSKEPLRFQDEFVRHKILDIIGDLMLLGAPIKAHIVAVRPGHALNAELTKELARRFQALDGDGRKAPSKSKAPAVIGATETELDIRRILDILPHAYPFLMIDRVVDIPNDRELVAIKNVSINEPYFQGHFPGQPVMPGVLQVEAMAQSAGVLMLRLVAKPQQVAFFMSCDKVKFRRAVVPGDQLEIRVKLTKVRGNKIATASAECRVAGKVVSSADLMFTMLDAPEEA